jgi:hypothetical protein
MGLMNPRVVFAITIGSVMLAPFSCIVKDGRSSLEASSARGESIYELLLPEGSPLGVRDLSNNPHRIIHDSELVAIMSRDFSKSAMWGETFQLGRHNGVPVVAIHPCSDICPDYTVRIVYYELPPGKSCADAGGRLRLFGVPEGISIRTKEFCVPPVLGDPPEKR